MSSLVEVLTEQLRMGKEQTRKEKEKKTSSLLQNHT